MGFRDIIKKSVLEGFSQGLPTGKMIAILAITFAIGIYIFFIYRLVNRTSFYDRRFHISLSILSVITAGIIIAMQSSIVISLGMVGALSIVRFRTAVKDALDLVFLFWAIGIGIICGAGLFELAIIVSLIVTAGIFLLELIPLGKKPYLLIINCTDGGFESELKEIFNNYSKKHSFISRNIKKNGADYIVEIDTGREGELLEKLNSLDRIVSVSLLKKEGEMRV